MANDTYSQDIHACHTADRDDATRRECDQGFGKVTNLVTSMGFDTVLAKNVEPTKTCPFLGGELASNTYDSGKCSKGIDDARRAFVIQECFVMEHTRGTVRASRISSLQGLLSFCATIIDIRLYLRSGFDLIRGRDSHEYVSLSQSYRKDLAFIRKLLKVASPRTMLDRRPLTSIFSSWDASTGWGLGCFCDGKWEYLSWADMLQLPNQPAFYPKPGTPT